MSESLPDMSGLLKMFKTNYLDNRDVGIRRFANMTNISRTRLLKLFDGSKKPTEEEIAKISFAMDIIETESVKKEELKQKAEFKNELNSMLREMGSAPLK